MTLDENTNVADAQDQKVFAITGTFSVFAYLPGFPRDTWQNLPSSKLTWQWFWTGGTSSNGCFSIVMLVLGGVNRSLRRFLVEMK